MAGTHPNRSGDLKKTPLAAGGLARKFQSSIGRRLTVCFLIIAVSMIAADAVVFWQFRQMVAPNRRLINTDQMSLAILRLHLNVRTLRRNVAALESSHATEQFSTEAAALQRNLSRNVEDAQHALRKSPENAREDPTIPAALETLKVTLPSQLDAVVELAAAGDWNAVRLRLEHQIQNLIDLSSSLVEKMDLQAQQQRTKAIEDAETAQRWFFVVVPIAGLLTLILAATLGWYVTQSVKVPLGELASGAEALARGDFQYQVHVGGNDELAVVGRAFNHAARQLQELYEELREQASLLGLTHDAVYVRDMKGVVHYWNRGAEVLYGWPEADAAGKVAHKLLKTVPPLPFEQIDAELLVTGRWEGELVKTRKDGTQLVVASRWSLKRDDGGAPIAILVTSNDITARKRAEEVARRSEKELRDVIETVPAMVSSASPDGAVDFINHRWEEFTGLAREAALGRNWEAVVHPDDHARFASEWRAALIAGQPMESELRLRAATGEYRWLFVRNVPLRDEQGKIVKWYGTSVDVHERKQAEKALQRNEAYLAEAQRLAHTGSWAWNPLIEECFYWSEEMYRIFALDPQQGLPTSETFWPRIHPEDRESMRELLWKSALEKTEYTHDHRLVLPDGSVKHIHAIGHPVLDKAGKLAEYVGTAMDVTEHKRAEETLRESETRFRTFVDHAGDAFFVYDLEQKTIVDVNREACESLAYTRRELIGNTPFAYHLDWDQAEMESVAERAMAGETVFDTHYHRRKDGTVFPVEVHTSLVTYAGRRFLMMVARDTSDRVRAEEQRESLRQLEAQLAHMNRVTMLGELGASLAHELNQPITGAITSADACLRWLARESPDLERARAATMRVKKDGTRAAEIIKRLRAFYKKAAPPHRESVNVHEVVNEMGVLLCNEAARHSVTFRTEVPTELPEVLADRVQLQQVFMNLMLNAIEAMQDTGGELTIRSQQTGDDMLLMSISDSGVGLPREGVDQIFDAFFTTKRQGTGMGLAITRSIVEAHGGRLWASPNAERGVTFYFTLPADVGAKNEQSGIAHGLHH